MPEHESMEVEKAIGRLAREIATWATEMRAAGAEVSAEEAQRLIKVNTAADSTLEDRNLVGVLLMALALDPGHGDLTPQVSSLIAALRDVMTADYEASLARLMGEAEQITGSTDLGEEEGGPDPAPPGS